VLELLRELILPSNWFRSLRAKLLVIVAILYFLFWMFAFISETSLLLIFPVFILVLHIILVYLIDSPLKDLLQLTRHGGFDLLRNETKILGRDEFSRLARAIVAMARRMTKFYEETQEQSSRLDEIFNAIGEGVMIVSAEGKVLKMNHVLSGWVNWYGDATGRYLTDVIRSVELSRAVSKIFEPPFVDSVLVESLHLSGQSKLSLESEIERRVQVKIVPVIKSKVSQGTVIRNEIKSAMIFLFDRSEVQKTELMRKEFFANVSHELKTPLSAIRGYSEIIGTLLSSKKNIIDASKEIEFLEVIERNSKQMTKMVDEMLTLAKAESGQIGLDKKPYSLKTAFNRVLETLLPKATIAQVEILCDLEEPELFADKERMDSVLLNLMDNGIKYNRAGGYVKFSSRKIQEGIALYVEDNGLGLTSDAKKRVFERFFRVDKSHTRLGGGSGLGLSIVKHLVQAHGGTVSVRSEYGSGTVFTLLFPDSLKV
jgi:two-component system, OmpR family, phosphate regulon sensor histidine kinase PhoR